MNKAARIIAHIFVVLATLTAAALLLLQTPFAQGRLLDYAQERFLEGKDASISFSKVHFRPFNTLIIRDFALTDKNPQQPSDTVLADFRKCHGEDYVYPVYDTLFRAGTIVAQFSLKGLFKHEGIHFSRVLVRDGRFNLVIEQKGLLVNLQRMFGLKRSNGDPKDNRKELFFIEEARLRNMTYSMQNIRNDHPKYSGGIDWCDLMVTGIDADAKNLKMSKGIMSGELLRCSFREKSGLEICEVTGRTAVGRGQALVENIHIRDRYSDIRAEYYSMSFNRPGDFRTFTSKVRIDGKLTGSLLSTRTLAPFISSLSGVDLLLDARGELHGTVEDFEIGKMRVSTVGHDFSTGMTGRFTSLTDKDKFHLDVDLRNCRTSTSGIAGLVAQATGGKVKLPDTLPKVRGVLNVCVKGKPDRLRLDIGLSSDAGNLSSLLDVNNLTIKDSLLRIGGRISTNDLDVSRLTGKDLVHECTADAVLRASMRGKEGPEVSIDTLNVRRLNINNYDYSRILATGNLSSRRFNGRIISQDPNFSFLFQGIFSFSPKTNNALYQFYANIGHADLHALNFDQRENSTLSLTTNANFNRTGRGILLGSIDVNNIRLTNDDERHNIGSIHISSRSTEGQYRANLTSSFAEASYFGTGSYIEFVNDLVGITARRELPSLFREGVYRWSGNRYELQFKCLNMKDVTAFFKPGLFVDNNSSGRLRIDSGGRMDAEISSRRLAIGEKYLRNLRLTFDNANGKLNGELSCEDINLNAVQLKDNTISLFAEADNIGVGFRSDGDGDSKASGGIYARGKLSRRDEGPLDMAVDILPSGFNIGEATWSIMPATVKFSGPDLKVDRLRITSGEQEILIDGGMAKEKNDTLSVRLENFSLAIANLFTGKLEYGIQGNATGEALIVSHPQAGQQKGFLIDIVSDSTSFAGTSLGTVGISSKWDEEFKRFDLAATNSRSFDISGTYTPSIREAELSTRLKGFDIGIATPFMHGVFSAMTGTISGNIDVQGPLDNLSISSSGGHFDNTVLTVDYTHVPYLVTGPFRMDENGLYFDNMTLSDLRRGHGTINGAVKYDHFKDIALDIDISAVNSVLIDKPASDKSGFYGRLVGDGSIRIHGPLKMITLDINGVTNGGGEFHIPMNSSSQSSSGELLSFKEEEKTVEIDPYEEMMAELGKRRKSDSQLAINIKARATPSVESFLEVNKATGNFLNGRGNGSFEIESRPAQDIFRLKGDYTLSGGKYNFNALGLAVREFEIKEGSNIKFNGDIMDSDLDIEATYRTKASLARLISDTTSVNTRRVVECGLLIGNKLSSPSLGFNINIPDLEPSVKSKVENALSTEDKVQKQFISLLVSNNFLPDEQSGVNDSANTSFIYSSVSSVFTNQLNNILQKLNIPLDFDMRYQQNLKGNDVFDVAVSTQLFNNRVVVNGNIGNRQYNTGNSNSNVVGDLDIEIKLDKSGALRLNLFSHSADQYTNYLDNSQRNGIGFTLQQEFNNFAEMLQRMFAGKKKREELDLREQEKAASEPKTVIEIGPGEQ
ncbi:MAG: translocation/assembly module TamB domain-containing protein [Bacteroidales bacterium]|nr:translocation/assembly module TamB domain-containing protein [Bacteroidales bacterium]